MDRSDFYWLASSVWLILLHNAPGDWFVRLFWVYLLSMSIYHTWFKKKPPVSYKFTINFGDDKKLRNQMADEFKLALDNEEVEVKTVKK